MPIHATAVVDPRAEIDPSAEVGPYVVIEGPVRIGPRTRVMAGAYLTGHTTLGPDNVVHPHAVLGDEPQDYGYDGGPTELLVGARNVFREHCEVHRATDPGTRTEIGDDNYLMSRAHVAHNCRLGNHVILATGATLGGHVDVGDRAFISGNCVVHQHCRVGRLSLMRGLARASRDVPPFAIVDGTHVVRGLNRIGLRRAEIPHDRIRALATAFRILYRVRTNLRTAMARVGAEVHAPEVDELLAFIRASKRGVAMGPARRGAAGDGSVDDAE